MASAVKGLNFDKFISGRLHDKHAIATLYPNTTLVASHPDDGKRDVICEKSRHQLHTDTAESLRRLNCALQP
jgi:hypothetical protein